MAELDAQRAQKLNNAAKTIQRKTRTHIARKHFLALQMAAVCIQSICRGFSIDRAFTFEIFTLLSMLICVGFYFISETVYLLFHMSCSLLLSFFDLMPAFLGDRIDVVLFFFSL